MRVAVVGIAGRMGQKVREVAEEAGHEVIGVDPRLTGGPTSLDQIEENVDVVIDFSSAAGTERAARWCASHEVPLVTGTTALHEGAVQAIGDAARVVGVVQAANFSMGINLLMALVEKASAALAGYDIEIMEIHHGRKKDAPSGTALALARAAASSRDWGDDAIFTERPDGERPKKRIGVQALRGGDVKGEHTVFVIGDTERLELTHRAYDRSVFAQGALRAAEWVAGKSPGLYSMRDVLSL